MFITTYFERGQDLDLVVDTRLLVYQRDLELGSSNAWKNILVLLVYIQITRNYGINHIADQIPSCAWRDFVKSKAAASGTPNVSSKVCRTASSDKSSVTVV